MNFPEKVRRRIRSVTAHEQALWRTLVEHSWHYMQVLKLKPRDLEALERSQHHWGSRDQGFARVTISGEEFSLTVKHVCCLPYGGRWMSFIIASCTSNPMLNASVGGGTTLMNVVPDDWHIRLLERLRSNGNGLTPVN